MVLNKSNFKPNYYLDKLKDSPGHSSNICICQQKKGSLNFNTAISYVTIGRTNLIELRFGWLNISKD